jgi:AraC-like DNA-binding protein
MEDTISPRGGRRYQRRCGGPCPTRRHAPSSIPEARFQSAALKAPKRSAPGPRGVERFLRDYQARAGFYREFAPAPDLRDLVACNWVSVVQHGKFGPLTPIIPDGCCDIMLYDTDVPQVVGPDTRTRWTDLRDGLVITGLRLRPGAVRAVFGCSASLLLDQQPLLQDLRPVSDRLLDALNFASSLERRHALLEEWLRHARQDISANDRALLAACRLLAADTELVIDAVARNLGWNARMIHRQFVAACGYGPKYLQRVLRVQAALRVAHDGSQRLRLSDIAGSAGFADQAHMTREFRALTGFTPTEYLAAYRPEVGAWLAADWGVDRMSESFKTEMV